MPFCFVCHQNLDVDEPALAHHINQHFDATEGDDGAHDLDQLAAEYAFLDDDDGGDATGNAAGMAFVFCPICLIDFSDLPPAKRESHAARHFKEDDAPADTGSSACGAGPSSRSRPSWLPGGTPTRHRHDLSWYPPSASYPPRPSLRPPTNYTPCLIPLLVTILSSSPQTRAATLCSPKATTHITSSLGFDGTWGCGYRNTQMAISSLYGCGLFGEEGGRGGGGGGGGGGGRKLWGTKHGKVVAPGIFDVQTWIEEAWGEGFDPQGKAHFRGKLKGTKKWIGVADIWTGLSAMGVPTRLIDFPKTTDSAVVPSHVLLQRWVVNYFSADDDSDGASSESNTGPSSRSALDVLSASGGTSVRARENKLPLILQHQGHSRTIVGIESMQNGDTNFLLFDPAKTIPTHLRALALHKLGEEQQLQQQASTTVDDNDGGDDEDQLPPSKRARLKGILANSSLSSSSTRAATVGKTFEAPPPGKWRSDIPGALAIFRLNLKSLKKHAEYQLLCFEPVPPGGETFAHGSEEWAKRKEVFSERIVK